MLLLMNELVTPITSRSNHTTYFHRSITHRQVAHDADMRYIAITRIIILSSLVGNPPSLPLAATHDDTPLIAVLFR